mgnify:FL=1
MNRLAAHEFPFNVRFATKRIPTHARSSLVFAITVIEIACRNIAGAVAEPVAKARRFTGRCAHACFALLGAFDIGSAAITGIEAAQTVGAGRLADVVAKIGKVATESAFRRVGGQVGADAGFVDHGFACGRARR